MIFNVTCFKIKNNSNHSDIGLDESYQRLYIEDVNYWSVKRPWDKNEILVPESSSSEQITSLHYF